MLYKINTNLMFTGTPQKYALNDMLSFEFAYLCLNLIFVQIQPASIEFA